MGGHHPVMEEEEDFLGRKRKRCVQLSAMLCGVSRMWTTDFGSHGLLVILLSHFERRMGKNNKQLAGTFFLLFSVWDWFSQSYICIPHVCPVPVRAWIKCWIPWNWGFKWLWTSIWVLELNLEPLQDRAASVNCWAISADPCCDILWQGRADEWASNGSDVKNGDLLGRWFLSIGEMGKASLWCEWYLKVEKRMIRSRVLEEALRNCWVVWRWSRTHPIPYVFAMSEEGHGVWRENWAWKHCLLGMGKQGHCGIFMKSSNTEECPFRIYGK